MTGFAMFAVLIPILQAFLIIAAIIALFYLTAALKLYIRKNR